MNTDKHRFRSNPAEEGESEVAWTQPVVLKRSFTVKGGDRAGVAE